VGGLAGKGVAERINPTDEHAYWRENFADRPYAEEGTAYDDYAPAYQYGWEAYEQHGANRNWDELESDLGRNWESRRGGSRLGWDQAREPARDAWERVRGGTGTPEAVSAREAAGSEDSPQFRRSAEMGGKAPRIGTVEHVSPATGELPESERGHRGEGPCAPGT
jgi:hypothetical protein